MDIREASYIVEIARTKTLTTAANNLYITQPALSKVLKKLETEFDAPLFYKEGKNLLPTPVGKIILQHSKSIMKEFSNMNHEVNRLTNSGQARLNIGISMMSGFLFAPILAAFCAQYPTIQLVTVESGANDIFQAFKDGTIDLALAPSPEESGDYNEMILFSSQIAVGVNSEHPWAGKDYIRDEDFIDQPYISWSSDARVNTMLKNRFKDKVVPIQKVAGREVLTIMTIASMTDTPIILPEPHLRFNGWKDMVIRHFSPEFLWSFGIVYPKKNQLPKTARLFVNFTEEYLSKQRPYLSPRGTDSFDLSEYVMIQ